MVLLLMMVAPLIVELPPVAVPKFGQLRIVKGQFPVLLPMPVKR